MNASGIKAVIDTSAIIQLREERYAPEVFPSLNRMVEQLAEQGGLITVDRVVEELAGQYSTGDDHADPRGRTMGWTESVMSQPYDFDPFTAMINIGNLTAEIANQHQTWQNGNPADPMVIAAAEFFWLRRNQRRDTDGHRRGRPETDQWHQSDPESRRSILELDKNS